MKVPGDPNGVVNHLIHLVRSVDNASRTGWNKCDHADKRNEKTRVTPRKLAEPAEKPFAAKLPAAHFKHGKHAERRHKRWNNDHEG